MILLDNRYEYDSESGERLGQDQWQWLENALSRQDKVNLTVIGAGI